MAINENTALPNRNTLYIARSGGGKSQALGQSAEIPKTKARVILWDPNNDHKASQFDNRKDFARAIATGLKTGKGFRIAYTGTPSPEIFEWWCAVVWEALDGSRLLYAVAEELSAVCMNAAKAGPNAARLMNQGRKYGLHFHGTTQKPQEIYKTFYDQSEVFYIGQQRGAAVDKFAKDLGIDRAEVQALKPLQFWRLDPKKNDGEPEKIALKYRKVN